MLIIRIIFGRKKDITLRPSLVIFISFNGKMIGKYLLISPQMYGATLFSAQHNVRHCRGRGGEQELLEVASTLVCLHRGQMLSSSIESPSGTGGHWVGTPQSECFTST